MMLPVTAKEDLPTAMIPSAYSFFNVFQPEEHLQDLLQRSSPPLSAVRVVSGSLTTTFPTNSRARNAGSSSYSMLGAV